MGVLGEEWRVLLLVLARVVGERACMGVEGREREMVVFTETELYARLGLQGFWRLRSLCGSGYVRCELISGISSSSCRMSFGSVMGIGCGAID